MDFSGGGHLHPYFYSKDILPERHKIFKGSYLETCVGQDLIFLGFRSSSNILDTYIQKFYSDLMLKNFRYKKI